MIYAQICSYPSSYMDLIVSVYFIYDSNKMREKKRLIKNLSQYFELIELTGQSYIVTWTF